MNQNGALPAARFEQKKTCDYNRVRPASLALLSQGDNAVSSKRVPSRVYNSWPRASTVDGE